MPSSPVLLDVRDLQKSYAGTPVLRGVSFTLNRGERLALTGPSGSGKTTLLNCLGGVDRTDSGTLLFDSQAIERLDSNALAKLRRTRLGTIFQFFHLLPTLSAYENVEFPLQLLGCGPTERRDRVKSLLDRVGISHRSHALPSEMSGGEMQRVAIARALVHKPALLLADEPTGNLDSANGEIVLALLKELSEETGTSLVLVTHSEEATRICHRTIRMKDGGIMTNDQ